MELDRACRRTVLALPWLLNGSLEADERRTVREHLIGCPACRTELARTREMLATVQAAWAAAPGQSPAPASFDAARRRRLGHSSLGHKSLGHKTILRLSWAAMIGAAMASAGALWWANTSSESVDHAQRGSRPRSTVTATRQTPATAQVLSAMDFERGSLAASLPTGSATGGGHTNHATHRPAGAQQPRQRAMATFNFENGTLDEWH